MTAIRLALENARNTITIHTDSLTAVNTLSNRKLHVMQRLTINWIPARTGIPGNEKTDHAAKRGLQLDRIHTT